TAPDHRHRCYAEQRPAPRALAHQEAYCLASAFPVCPTFQDWARREAAAARPGAGVEAAAVMSAERDEEPPMEPMVPVPAEPPRAFPVAAPYDAPPRRNPPRDWAAPPPWTGDEPQIEDLPPAAVYPAASSPSDPVAPDPGDWGSDSRGLAGSAADRLAGPDPDESAGDDLDAWAAGAAGAAIAGGYAASGSASRDVPPVRRRRESRRDARRQGGSASDDAGRGAPQQDPSELFGPAWERPSRYEAYPSLRTRIGLPSMGGIPRLGVYALVLAAAALFLFFVGPMLLGIGKDDPGAAGASASPAATTEATTPPLATEPPVPTAQVYLVVKGDTISKIAKKNGVTVEELLAANKQIKNPNKIKIGDEITIPVPVVDGSGDGTVESSTTP
ncbi:MAG: LysM peptidoglycan-binding domain-containing protein, partial [Chloroflexi bacterium]|nr:LysM peptidoglycan-binding domain-containing protein [Chloroflexota bacterium]